MPSKMNMVFSLKQTTKQIPSSSTPKPSSTPKQTNKSRFSMYNFKQVVKGCKSCGS